MALFLFFLLSGVGCDFCLWLFLDFFVYHFEDFKETTLGHMVKPPVKEVSVCSVTTVSISLLCFLWWTNRKLRLKTLSFCLENISSLRINVWKRFQFFYTSNLTLTKDLKLKKKFIFIRDQIAKFERKLGKFNAFIKRLLYNLDSSRTIWICKVAF